MTEIQTEQNIFLSIVTISFNQADYLGALLDSVCYQMAEDVEFIVVDPGSTDGSRDTLRARQDCITQLVLEPDDGPADGLNRGFALARGKIGYFINSDDVMMPSAVAHLRRLWSEHTEADILLGNAWMIDSEGRPIRELHATRNVALRDFLTDRAVVVQQGMSFRMDAFRDVGGFNVANRTCWDYELLCGMLANGAKAMRVSDRLGAFRMSGDNISSGVGGASHVQRFQQDKARILQKFSDSEQSNGPLQRAISRGAKLTGNPLQILCQIADKAAPIRVRNRWAADMLPARGS